ncbi:hypothetical protein OJ996_08800 [Luteolibacter sp. GHJ8]|uniref:Uncharacterized protein n=1 Tax=Luteolibacter rhizosphaerae TaxID=2989719 RepID=A0ABT3G1E9_9BACT|nr:hypothetical protein [Luteolibacter rhizosphaerae]MCW1913671.1 hypothetical protein [Luteolibacter rhizosphaerae]
MRKILISLALLLPVAAADLEFKEAFADPTTREASLTKLVPQTRDWFFYQALNHQLSGRSDEFGKVMDQWLTASERKEDPVSSDGFDSLMNRQQLLSYDADPRGVADFLIKEAGLEFKDTKPDAEADAKLPDRLDPAMISVAAFENLATRGGQAPYRRYSPERLAAELAKVGEFDEAKLEYFRETLVRADLPGIVPLLAKIHASRSAPSFGSVAIELRLTRSQMDELATAVPALRGNEAFVTRYLETLLPGDETDFALDPGAHAAHLAACREVAITLPPALNSLKAHVLYHHLRLQRDLGQFPQEDFLSYLKLLRSSHSILKVLPNQGLPEADYINTGANYSAATACPPVNDDRELIDAYLNHFLGGAETPELFKDLIENKRLIQIHARARLLAGGNPVEWGPSLDPAELLELQKETRIAFAPGQPLTLLGDTAVKLALDLKNTPELLVRIFELDLPSWIERENSEPPVSLDLEGLVPHHEKRLNFPQPPLLIHREQLELPELSGPGAWIVECVSKGVSSRALIRKGRLVAFVDREARGQSVRVFDEAGTILKDAAVAIGAESFNADADGRILIPDKTGASRSSGFVRRGKLAVPLELRPRKEEIALDARFHLDREQLLADRQASVFLRLRLNSHGQEIPLEWIERPSLKMTATLINGQNIERVIGGDLKLAPALRVPLQVPADTMELRLELSGWVTPRDGAAPILVNAFRTWEMNRMIASGQIAAGFFTRDTDGYRLELRGRNGEPLGLRPVVLAFTHRHYELPVEQTLRSDERGRIALGMLTDITEVTATNVDISQAALKPDEEGGWNDLPKFFHIAAGEEIKLPLLRPMAALDRTRASLQEFRDATLLRDHFDKLALENGRIVLRGLPAGKFVLTLDGRSQRIHVSGGVDREGLLVSPSRILPRHSPSMPFIVSATPEAGNLVLKVNGAAGGTRVSLIGRRYLHHWAAGTALQPFANPLPGTLKTGFTGNAFLEASRVSDEVRYILERRAGTALPGSMLPRPGLLLNRWSEDPLNQETQTGKEGREGNLDELRRKQEMAPEPSAPPSERDSGSSDSATIDFLANASVLKLDLEIGAEGTLQVPAGDFAQCQYLEIVAANGAGRHHLNIPLVPTDTPLRDRRLAKPLDAQKYHIGTRRAAVLAKGAEAKIESVIDADWRAFTTLEEAFDFLYDEIPGSDLLDFSELLDWPILNEEEKLAFLGEHACHELHLFIARKDADFFKKHVQPMLAEKREPTVIDQILLGRDLTAYLRPYAWQKLNAAEKALLAQAMPEARERIVTELRQRWELEAPTPEQESMLFSRVLRKPEIRSGGGEEGDPYMASSGTQKLLEKLNEIVIPVIDFEDISVEEAVDFLRLRSRELDRKERDPARKGISFVIRKPRTGGSGDAALDADAAGGLGTTIDPGALRIRELRLRNVPLAEVLKYMCGGTKLRYKVDEFAVTFVPATETDEDLFNRTFKVPPNFRELLQENSGDEEEQDPFASDRGESDKRKWVARPRLTDEELLKISGVKFPEGATAKFFPGNNTLLVRNTPTNLDLIEGLLESMGTAQPNFGRSIIPPSSGGADSLPAARDPFAESSDLLAPPPMERDADPFSAADGGAMLGAVGQAAQLPNKALPSWSSERDQTRLWRESNYYRYRGKTGEGFIPLNRFWLDLAAWDGKGGFISPHFNACTRNLNEAVFCLAMLDLPFKAEGPETGVDGSSLRVKAREPMILFYKDTRETQQLAPDAPVLVRQTFHRLDDRFRTVEGRKIENSITGEFVAGVPYGASMVVTNPSGAGRRIDVMAQIPAGSIPLAGLPATASQTFELQPYGVQTLDLAFYFPTPGEFAIYPLQVSEGDLVLARSEIKTLKVVTEAPADDADSWPVLARDASDAAVLERLKKANLRTLDLGLIRWRLRDRGFFHEATKILRERLHYSPEIAAYGLFHGEVDAIRDLIENSSFAKTLGPWLDSPLIQVRPLVHRDWATLEFDPLVNPRAHRFADKERLTHAEAKQHYTELLDILAWKPELDADDQLALTAHLLLQDRVAEALERFDRIEPAKLPATMAYDYIAAVVSFYRSKPEEARAFAVRHAQLPPGPWQQRFAAILSQADEIAALAVPRPIEQEKPKEEIPMLDLALGADGKLLVKQRQLDKTLLQLFSVDLEMLFSKNPFLAGDGASLPGILANETREVPLAAAETPVDLPEAFRHGNVLVAAKSGTTRVLKVLDSRALEITRRPEERTLQVFDSSTRLPLPGSYVKVYAETDGGEAVFHKDGYTDLRGKFDYLSHTGSKLEEIRRIAILISHPEKGARIEVLDL